MTRLALTYPRIPIGGVYIIGTKSIEGATGDTAKTTTGWIENRKYGWYHYQSVANSSAEFDTAVTRTGLKTLKLSNTDTTGVSDIFPTSESITLAEKRSLLPTIKPSTAYVLSCWIKTNNTKVNACQIRIIQYAVDGTTGTISNSTVLDGTNDWTLKTISFTSDATARYLWINLRNWKAGNVSDAWFDVNSMTLVES